MSTFWVAVGGCDLLLIVAGGFEWLWVVVGGCIPKPNEHAQVLVKFSQITLKNV